MSGNKPGILHGVQKIMEDWGWTNGGGSNSVKIELGRGIIASHGDPTWIADIEKASTELSRQRFTKHGGFSGGGAKRHTPDQSK